MDQSSSSEKQAEGWTTGVEIGASDAEKQNVREMVSKYYGETLQSSNDLKTSACTASGRPHDKIISAMKSVPNEIKEKYYGCGSPLPLGIENLNVLDLGSGSGQDCYIAASLVGENGNVIGIDMTDEQLETANKYVDTYCKDTLKYSSSNMKFIKGYIELIDDLISSNEFSKESIDLVISNCVINLSPNKEKVISGVYNALKYGGEMYFSDVYCDRRLPDSIRKHEILLGECLSGALYIEDFRRICQKVGFADPRILKCDEIEVTDKELKGLLGNAKFYSITYRLFKIEGIEDKCEDFGQVAIYKGTIEGNEHYYDLDDHHRFITNKPMLVCGNTALMVGSSWLGKHFNIIGDFNTHYGLFDCGDSSANTSASNNAETDGGCSPGGACC